jgi:hypothetical protein
MLLLLLLLLLLLGIWLLLLLLLVALAQAPAQRLLTHRQRGGQRHLQRKAVQLELCRHRCRRRRQAGHG